MGWEYHNRPRDDWGRWIPKHHRQLVEMHFKVRQDVYDKLREQASAHRMNMTDYVQAVLIKHWKDTTLPH